MISNGMKNQFNLKRPKFGLANYGLQNSQLEDSIYKADQIAMSKRDKKDHFTELHANLTAKVPSAKYDILNDWSKDPAFSSSAGRMRGKFLGCKKLTMSEQVMV